MPAKKGSIDKSLGRKVLDGAKYVGKNFWKVLPIGSSLNHIKKDKEKIGTIDYEVKAMFHNIYALAGVCIVGSYITFSAITGAWTPKQIKQYNEKIKEKEFIEAVENREVDFWYGRIFEEENAKTFQDSVDIYQKYGLPIKLLEPTIQQKENANKKNREMWFKSYGEEVK
jgi:hypothetical protein